jgi:A/G-specific adenine glycosylase
MVELPRQSVFAPALIAWQREHGRHGLPWQGSRDPYRVWLSEVMLQQTQVSTVLDYYDRFLQRFPDVVALAKAPLDDVLGLWSGLGYYSRARNLHRCAQAVCDQHGGVFPRSSTELVCLPGIGPSTAAAIAAFCFGERVSILDGNVRRVLTRLLAFDADVSLASSQQALWDAAQTLLPLQPSEADMVAYTQGLMDLGATVCTRTQPKCLLCPVQAVCRGQEQGEPQRFPVKTRKVLRRQETWSLLVLQRDVDGAVWLTQRPAKGIWAGLWTPPVHEGAALPNSVVPVLPEPPVLQEVVVHQLTHRELRLHPWAAQVATEWPEQQGWTGQWQTPSEWTVLGLLAPIRRYLDALPRP